MTKILTTWASLKEKIKNYGKLVVYKGHQPSQSVPPQEIIDDYHHQQLLAILKELGVNTEGLNAPAKKFTTYQEVINAAINFRTKWIETNESEKLVHLRVLIMKGNLTELKRLVSEEKI